MIRSLYYLLFIFFLIGFGEGMLHAQDIHFSQFHNVPSNLNPAITGVFEGDYRMVGNYRSQWQSVPVDYLTFSGAYDMKIKIPALKNGLIGGGIVFNTDQAGYANFRLLQIALNASYIQKITEEQSLSIGLQLGTIQQSFRPELLSFDEQWNGDVLDESIPVTENFNNNNISLGDISTGINWHYKSENLEADMGIGLFHLAQPRFSFFADDRSILENKMNFYMMGTHLLTEKIGYTSRLLFEMQEAHFEGLFGVGLVYYLNRNKTNEIGIQPSLNYRFDKKIIGDALIPMLEIFYQSWKVGLSYDVNVSDFIAATNRQGGVELSVQYIIKKVAPPEVFKACPIF